MNANQPNSEDNKSSFSFQIQIDLDTNKKGKEGFDFEDFMDFEQLKAEKERSYIDQPNFDPREIKEGARNLNQSANPFASDQASRDNTRSVVPVEEYIYNPFMTAEGSSHNTSAIKQGENILSPGLKQRQDNFQGRGQVSFGPQNPNPIAARSQSVPSPPASSDQPFSSVPSQNTPPPSPPPIQHPPSQFHPQYVVRQKFIAKEPVKEVSQEAQSNFFTFKRNLQNSRMTAAEMLVANLDTVRAEIQYYRQAIEKIQYESTRTAEKELEMTLITHQADQRLAATSKQIVKINETLQQLMRYQEELTSTLKKTTQERDALIEEVRQGLACQQQDNPTKQQSELYLELQQINKTLQQIEVDTQELQLSQIMSQGPVNLKEIESYSSMLSKLYELSQNIGYPKFVYNVKIACMRNRWILWENADLQVGVIYQKKTKELAIQLHLGNKSKRQLLQFNLTFADQAEPIFNKEILRELSYMRAQRRSANILQGLVNFSLSYETQIGKPTTCSLMVPIVFLHFGEFEAITLNLFNKKWGKIEAKSKSQFCAIDKDIIQQLDDVKKYLHNLMDVTGKNGDRQLAGLFKFSSGVTIGQQLLIKIKSKGGLLGFTVGCLPGSKGEIFSGETLAIIANTLSFIFAV